ncbi:rod shape-determining protein MreD [Pseudacidobacterium ailaaui]|jgi:rod shape-determining protein MreD|uniref:rod shape-determining protein MreD n=1 Tax=Pseudacidobacterium ailaaui TaxID=1382359 RepID=UPI00047A733B|nr:rod shape-determining protein MreD [Pseudacidobacterium ailaaui]MBX6361035.1 rod shape-determining protein MreD [Pseudacidobacterium ailaaui]MCL6463890.1 rod shape-determining protein MreD [Pseudacidobacterium ailaaui]MDI3255693.1 rod shape-determining protein MreD [Bacillota bacterium]
MLSAATRSDPEIQTHPFLVYVLAPLLALGLQSFLVLHFHSFAILDLPLLVTIYFAISHRHPVVGTITGALIGIAQDALTRQPLGIFGICKSIVGYLAASLGVRIDTENHLTRLILTFCFVFLHSGIDWLLVRRLLAQPFVWGWLHESLRAILNALAAVVLFALLDKTRRREY